MINTNESKKKRKKESTAIAIAKAKAWADARRRKSSKPLQSAQASERKHEVMKVVKDEGRIALLKSMLNKERQLIAESKLRIELIERELKTY